MSKAYIMAMSCLFGAFMGPLFDNEARKEQIKQEFRDTVNLPRKQKKKRRKELQLDWSIANWNPLEI